MESKNIELEITNNELAGMMMKGFSDLRVEINERFEQVDKRFDSIEAKVELLISDVENIKERLSSIEEFIQTANRKIEANKEDTDSLYKEMTMMKKRILEIENILKSKKVVNV